MSKAELHAGLTLSPELKLLLRCAGISSTATIDGEIRALIGPDLNWRTFCTLADQHRITCLAYRRLSQTCPEQVPAKVLRHLQFRYQANTAINLQLCHRLAQVLQLLNQHGIEALTLKGPALAAQAYAEPTVREFRDLDLLVRRADALRTRELLEAAGYAGFPQLSAPQLRVFLRSECEFWFSSPGDEVPVEVHWDLREAVYAYPLNSEVCWSQTGSCEIAGQRVPTLSPGHTLLMLSCHGAKHRWAQLRLIRDLAEFLRAYPDLDWDDVLHQADHLHGLRMLLLGLQLAALLLDAPLPEPVRRRSAQDRSLAPLVADVTAHLLDNGRAERQAASSTQLYLRMRERWQDRLRYCGGTLLTPTLEDWNSITLPEPLFPLYYVVRPLRLLIRPLLSLFRPRAPASEPEVTSARQLKS